MSEQRTERVIEGAARPGWGRAPVAFVAVVSLLLAAIVGMTSSASPWSADDGERSSPPGVVGEALGVGLAVGLCILLAVIWVGGPRRIAAKRGGGKELATDEIVSSLRAGSGVLIGGILVVAALIGVFLVLLRDAQPPAGSGVPVETPKDTRRAPPPGRPSHAASATFDWFVGGLVVATAIMAPVAFLARRRRSVADETRPEDDEAPEAVVRAPGESIEQIEHDPDPRRAIIRAYARMEHAFREEGIPRRAAEAPFEYLGRALGILRVSPPAARRLATLFERARFSQHATSAATKYDAIGALREIERELQVTST